MKIFILILAIGMLTQEGWCLSKNEIIKKVCDVDMQAFLPELHPSALFLAGIPGSGKSTVLRSFKNSDIGNLNKYFLIDSDQYIVLLDDYIELEKQGRLKEAVNKNQETAVQIREAVTTCAKEKRLSLIIDGTMVNVQKNLELIKNFKDSNYSPWIMYINACQIQSWERVKKREELEGRTVTKEYFDYVTQNLPESIKQYIEKRVAPVIAICNPEGSIPRIDLVTIPFNNISIESKNKIQIDKLLMDLSLK